MLRVISNNYNNNKTIVYKSHDDSNLFNKKYKVNSRFRVLTMIIVADHAGWNSKATSVFKMNCTLSAISVLTC